MSSDSGEPLRVEESVQNKEATGCFDEKLSPDYNGNKMEAVDIDKPMAENQMNISEDKRYSEQVEDGDYHEFTAGRYKDSCDNRHDTIDDSFKADTQDGSNVRSIKDSNVYQSFDDVRQVKQDNVEPEDNEKSPTKDTSMSTDLESCQVHAVEVFDCISKEVPSLMASEFKMKDKPSVKRLTIEGSSIDTELIQAYNVVEASIDIDTTVDKLQESTIDENYFNQSINKHDFVILQTEDQQRNDVESKLETLQTDLINDCPNVSKFTDTDGMLQEIEKISERNLKIINSNDQHDVNIVLSEKSDPTNKQENKSLETDLVDLNDDRFLEAISRSLINRDMTMYDHTFLGINHKESVQIQHEIADSNLKISEENQQITINDKLSVEIEDVPGAPSVESISSTTDVIESSGISQLKITENIKLLKVEEPDNISKNSDKVSLLINLVQASTSKESSLTGEKNIELQSLIKDESNLSEIQALTKTKELEEPTNVIQKLQNMNWLKPQLASESAMARSRKAMQKNLPKKDERAEDYLEGKKKNDNNSRININNSAQCKSQTTPALHSQPVETTVQATASTQPSVWNKNTVDQLFPEAHLANIEDEQLSAALAESICTAQQECEKRKMAGNLKMQIHDQTDDDDEWGKQNYRNLSDEPSDLMNYPKGLVDKYGRVDGYTEKHLYIGKEARRREQAFLKAQTENANSQELSLSSNTQDGSTNARSQETHSQSSQVLKKDTLLPNKTQQAPSSARSDKDTPKEKPGFNQGSSRGQRRGSAGKIETKSESRSTNKNQQNPRNEKEETKNIPGFENSSKNSQQQQRGHPVNQGSKVEVRDQFAKLEIKTAGESQQGPTFAGFEDMPNRDKPGFNQGPINDPYPAPRKQDLNSNKSQQSSNSNRYNQSDNKNDDKFNRQHGNFDRCDSNSKKMDPLNKTQDKYQYNRSQNQDYYNKNQNQDNPNRNQNQDRFMRNFGQDYSTRNQTQGYSDDRNKMQDHSGRHQTQDRYQSQDNYNRNRGQDRFDRNQNQDNLNRNQSQEHSHKTQHQESGRNQSSFGRFQENFNKNPNLPDRNQTNRVDHEYLNRNQSYDKYNESRNRDQDRYNRNQDNANKTQDRFSKAHSEENWDESADDKSKLNSHTDRHNASRNKDQDRYHKYQDSGNKYQENVNINQDRCQIAQSEDCWINYESTKPKSSFPRISDNKSQQQSVAAHNQRGYYNEESSNIKSCDQYKNANSQENRKVVVEKTMDLSIKTNTISDNRSAISTRSNITSSTQSNNSISSIVEAQLPLHHSTPNTTLLTAKEFKNDCKEDIPKAETVVTFSHVHETLTSEPRPNVVLAFEGNQNVQRALGLDINSSQAVQSGNSQLLNAAYINSSMNVNALPFEAPDLNPQQGLNCVQLDSTMSSLPLAFSSAPNISSVEAQLRMNEISNLSQDILRLHSTVASLAKQLASAQADLLAAQAKFSQYQQSVLPGNTTSPSIQAENQLPANFFTMQCTTPPGFTTPLPIIQKVIQPDAFQPKNYGASNIQQDFATEELQSNAALDQRLIQQYHLYQQQQSAANFQQYRTNVGANVTATSGVPRERIVPQSQPQPQFNKGRELRGCGSQFYN